MNHTEGVQNLARADDECIHTLLKLASRVQAVNLKSTNCSRKSNTPLIQKEEHYTMTLESVHALLHCVTFVPNTVRTLMSVTV